jgi:hypothetical protein
MPGFLDGWCLDRTTVIQARLGRRSWFDNQSHAQMLASSMDGSIIPYTAEVCYHDHMLALTVYCNCFETNKALPSPVLIKTKVNENGMLDIYCINTEEAPLMHEWAGIACPHPNFKAFHDDDFIGTGGAAMMRDEIGQQGKYPVLLEKVFVKDIHDNFLILKEAQVLKEEITRLDYDKLSGEAKEFINKLKKAIAASEKMQKPIAFKYDPST